MLKGLLTHCGDDTIANYDQLGDLTTPRPTASHWPIAHKQVVDLVKNKLQSMGIPVADEGYILANDKGGGQFDRIFGLLELDRSVFNLNSDDWLPTIGIRNSHDKAFPVSICGGSQTFVCSNLCFFGEYMITRRHTASLQTDIMVLVHNLVDQVLTLPRMIDEQNAAWKSCALSSKEHGDAIIVEAARKNIIPSSKILEVSQEWYDPNYDYEADPLSLFTLHEAFTASSLRPRSASQFHRNIGPMAELNTLTNSYAFDSLAETA